MLFRILKNAIVMAESEGLGGIFIGGIHNQLEAVVEQLSLAC